MSGSPFIARAFAQRFDVEPTMIGAPEPALAVAWQDELAAATPLLRKTQRQYQDVLNRGCSPVTALSRCAVALATVPAVATHRPDAVVVWFDAHADLNTPQTTTSGYLGGMALSGPLGWWDSGLGAGLRAENAVLVGVRDLDEAEVGFIDRNSLAWVKVGSALPEVLGRVVARRPAYVHIDCDVLEPGLVLTDYVVPDGLTLTDLRAAAETLAESEIVGIEIGEFEAVPHNSTAAVNSADALFGALEPILHRIEPRRHP